MRCLWVGWVLMAWVSGMMCAAGFLLPYWLKGLVGDSVSDLGLFRRCVFPSRSNNDVIVRMDCGHYSQFDDIPSAYWKVAFVFLAAACCLLLLLTFFLAFVGFRLELLRIRPVISVCAVAQGASGLLVILACLFYPLGWKNNPDVENACGLKEGRSAFYRIGNCQLGWAYVLTLAGGFLCSLTVGFPVQMAREYPEEELLLAAEKSGGCASSACGSTFSRSMNGGPRGSIGSPGGGPTGRYTYVTYHALHGPSRPLSQCTCTSDYTPHQQDFVQLCQGSPAAEAAAASLMTEPGGGGGTIPEMV